MDFILLLYNKQSCYCVCKITINCFRLVVKWKFVTTAQICEMPYPWWTDKQRVNAFTICNLENHWLKAVESGGPGPRGVLLSSRISQRILCTRRKNVLNRTTKKRGRTKWLNHFTNISRLLIRLVRYDDKSNWNQARMIK